MAISRKRREEIEAFVDEDISDIPEMTDEQLAQLHPSHLLNRENYRPVKKKVCMYLDADVLEHYKSKGKGYQTNINRVLRQGMLREIAPTYVSKHDEEGEHEN